MRHRLAEDAAGWVVDDLIDSFEPAFLSHRAAVEARKAKTHRPETPRGRRPADEDPA